MTGQHQSNWIIKELTKLALPKGGYAVFGSGILDVLGIRQANDIDLIVTKNFFNELKQSNDWKLKEYKDGYEGLEHKNKNIEVFYRAKMPHCNRDNIEKMINRAKAIDGINFVLLDDVLQWKKSIRRTKDLEDIINIKKYQEENCEI